MKEKTLGFIIGGLNLILIIVCVVFFLGKDRTAPVITIGECDYVYEEDLPMELLYQGVTAYDREDGDLTEQVVVEKVVTDRVNGKATITYGVSDSSGNIGKETRTLVMPVLTRILFPSAGEAESKETVDREANNQEENNETVEEATTEEISAGEENGEVVTTEEADTTVETEETNESEDFEESETEGEGTTTGGNVTVVGSNRRN